MGLIVLGDGAHATVAVRPGSGPALVLVHGAGMRETAFDELLPHLAGLDVVVPALPGRAQTDGPAPATAGAAAAYILAVVRALALPRVVVVGHSYGGAVALEVALAGDPAVVGLALLATGARLRVHPLVLSTMVEAAAAGRPAPLARALFRPETDEALFARVSAAAAATPPESTLIDWRAADAFDRMADLGRIGVPTLVGTGTDDALTPRKYSEFMAARIAGSRLLVLDGAGHYFPLERPVQTAETLRQLIHQVERY